MEKTIDFTDLPRKNKTYAGANGSKISVLLHNELYMIKFPAPAKRNNSLSYANGCVTEYIGSHIFNIVGIPAQETILGTFMKNGKEKLVVACKDFTSSDVVLQDFGSLKNTIIDSIHNGYGTELSDILMTIDNQIALEPSILKAHFWNMFIVDALIGNWDRHNGNWGFLYDIKTDEIKIAPIFDCGSSLYPQADEAIMKSVLNDQSERNYRIFNIPLSAIRQNGAKINYFEYISSLQNKDCNAALKRVVPKIDIKKISELIENTPYIDELQKSFYKTMIAERKERILDRSLKLLRKRERALER
ncbi:MAG: HipA domain-containing protein [Erysipelotrichaceae bacterium]|nr:HipA domain-containing protein [Erysipelotrichaceae bacterium]